MHYFFHSAVPRNEFRGPLPKGEKVSSSKKNSRPLLNLNALLKPPKLVALTATLPPPNLDGISFKSRLATSLVQT